VPSLTLRLDPDRPEGGFALDVRADGPPQIEIAGGPFSGVIYGVEELVQRQATATGVGVELTTGTIEQSPGLPYRTFWNWDHSTNWDMEQIGAQEIGVTNPYNKPPEGYLRDFKRCVDFMSRNRIAALAMFGFLRDSHGGIEASQELCRYARERGVRILPGVCMTAYGGVYQDGDHPYNLGTWLRKNPHLAAKMERPAGFQIDDLSFSLHFPRGDYTASACPSQPENQQWVEEGVAWITETFEVGGINIEAGDYGVCGCDRCTARRAEREDAKRREGYAESWSHADMADLYPRLYQAALSKRQDLWIYAEIQWDNLLDAEAMKPLRALPDGGIYQHTLNRTYWNRVRDELTAGYVDQLPTKTNVFRCQFACQWNGDDRTERYFFNGRTFHDMAKKAREVGMEGLTIWGEPSDYHAATELSYLAFARFSYDPSLSWESFIEQDVAPRLGGKNAAERFIALTEQLDRDREIAGAALDTMQTEALDAARQLDGAAARRWLTLAERIARRGYMTAS
jgi:hypothetical protein